MCVTVGIAVRVAVGEAVVSGIISLPGIIQSRDQLLLVYM